MIPAEFQIAFALCAGRLQPGARMTSHISMTHPLPGARAHCVAERHATIPYRDPKLCLVSIL